MYCKTINVSDISVSLRTHTHTRVLVRAIFCGKIWHSYNMYISPNLISKLIFVDANNKHKCACTMASLCSSAREH